MITLFKHFHTMPYNEKLSTVYSYPDLVNGLKVIECLSIVVVLIFLYVYVRILLKKEFCHINLRLLLIFQPLIHGFGLFFRIIRHIIDRLGFLDTTTVAVLNGLIDYGIATGTEVMFVMAIERVFAMYFVETYEENPSCTLGAVLCIGTIILWGFVIGGWNTGFLPTVPVYATGYAFMILAAVIFVVLPFVCRRAYKKVAQQRNATVAQRFRTARNLQAARLLMFLSPVKLVTNVLSITMYIFTYNVSEPVWVPFYSELYMIFNVLQMTLLMFLTLLLQKNLRSELLMWLHCKTNVVHPSEVVKSVSGTRMMFSAQEEQRMHFDHLFTQWNTKRLPPLPGKQEKYRAS